MTAHEQPWIVGLDTLLLLVKGATLAGWHKTVFADKLILRIEGQQYQGGEAFVDGLLLYEKYMSLCLDYKEGDQYVEV